METFFLTLTRQSDGFGSDYPMPRMKRDGFCLPAFVFGPIWFLAKGLWKWALLLCGIEVLVGALFFLGMLTTWSAGLLLLILCFMAGFEASFLLINESNARGEIIELFIDSPERAERHLFHKAAELNERAESVREKHVVKDSSNWLSVWRDQT